MPLFSPTIQAKMRLRTQGIKPFILSVALGIFGILSCSAQVLEQVTRASQNTSVVKFYLPIHEKSYPQLISGLAGELANLSSSEINIPPTKIITADNWHAYQQGLRHGRPGIYLAPPHFAAWAIEHHQFQALARISEPLSFVIVTTRDQPSLFEVNDLIGKTVCTSNPLNLDYLLINQAFLNTVRSANIKVIDSLEHEMRNPSSDCAAFSINKNSFDRLTKTSPEKWIRLQQSKRMNNYVFVAHPEIPAAQANALRRYFLSDNGQKIFKPVIELFADKARLVIAKPDDYPAPYSQVLENYWQ